VPCKSELSASREASWNLPTLRNLQHRPPLIGVEHTPINMNDLYLIQGVYPVRPSLPSVVGNEGVGRVLAIGRGVDHLKVGDRVLVVEMLHDNASPIAGEFYAALDLPATRYILQITQGGKSA
jgi:NADPH:quinone reductase-like Zn-dependent oxidoreductase